MGPDMKAFILSSFLVAAASSQLLGHSAYHGVGGQTSHQSVSKPYQGEIRSTAQSKAFGSPIASVSSHDSVSNSAQAGLATHLGQGAVLGGYHAAPTYHAAPAYHAPVVHAAPAYHAPVVHAAPAYHAPAYPDVPSPYTYTYAVSDDYSKANFNAAETGDGAGNAEGSYSVALPDGRLQHVNYKADGYAGYVADVTYEGAAVYPDAPAPYHAAPVPAYAG